MKKKIIIATFYSIVVFCVVSYLSVMKSLLTSVGNPLRKPVANLGYPFSYYYQFWLKGSDSPNCGWDFKNFVLDGLIVWIITITIYFIVKKNK